MPTAVKPSLNRLSPIREIHQPFDDLSSKIREIVESLEVKAHA